MTKLKNAVRTRQDFIKHIVRVERYCNPRQPGESAEAQKLRDEEAARYAAAIWDARRAAEE